MALPLRFVIHGCCHQRGSDIDEDVMTLFEDESSSIFYLFIFFVRVSVAQPSLIISCKWSIFWEFANSSRFWKIHRNREGMKNSSCADTQFTCAYLLPSQIQQSFDQIFIERHRDCEKKGKNNSVLQFYLLLLCFQSQKIGSTSLILVWADVEVGLSTNINCVWKKLRRCLRLCLITMKWDLFLYRSWHIKQSSLDIASNTQPLL